MMPTRIRIDRTYVPKKLTWHDSMATEGYQIQLWFLPTNKEPYSLIHSRNGVEIESEKKEFSEEVAARDAFEKAVEEYYEKIKYF